MMGSTIIVDHLTRPWATAAVMDLSTETWSRDDPQMSHSVAKGIAMVVFQGRPIGQIDQEIYGHLPIPSIDGLMPLQVVRDLVPRRTQIALS